MPKQWQYSFVAPQDQMEEVVRMARTGAKTAQSRANGNDVLSVP